MKTIAMVIAAAALGCVLVGGQEIVVIALSPQETLEATRIQAEATEMEKAYMERYKAMQERREALRKAITSKYLIGKCGKNDKPPCVLEEFRFGFYYSRDLKFIVPNQSSPLTWSGSYGTTTVGGKSK